MQFALMQTEKGEGFAAGVSAGTWGAEILTVGHLHLLLD